MAMRGLLALRSLSVAAVRSSAIIRSGAVQATRGYVVIRRPGVEPVHKEVKKPAHELRERPLSHRPQTEEELSAELSALASRIGLELNGEVYAGLGVAVTRKQNLNYSEQPSLGDHGRLSLQGALTLRQIAGDYFLGRFPSYPSRTVQSLLLFITSPDVCFEVGKSLGLEVFASEKWAPIDVRNFVSDNLFALVATIYQTKGLGRTREFFHDFFVPRADEIDFEETIKTVFPERDLLKYLILSDRTPAVDYRLVRESGRLTHLPLYEVAVYAQEGEEIGRGVGHSLKRAKEAAARDAVIRFIGADNGKYTLDTSVPDLPLRFPLDRKFTSKTAVLRADSTASELQA
eukprot:Opistho-2@83221